MLITHITKSAKDTQKLGENLAKEILLSRTSQKTVASARGFGEPKATVLALRGNLGAGKTTFLQGFAIGLGIKEKVLSPTYVVMKHFNIFYHFDCYRLKDEKDVLELGWKEIISNPKNIVAIEWPERIKKALPKNIIKINFKTLTENKREIKLKA